MCNGKKPLVILTGPTAVGKTRLSLELAKRLEGEVVSADSMQVYRYMDIGTAKLKEEDREGIRHYLIDEIDPSEEFNVVRFQEYAKRCCDEIHERNKIPIIVGGTGFYIQALLYDVSFTEQEVDVSYRKRLEELSREKGCEHLHRMLAKVDEESARGIHPKNVKRMVRALEYHHLTGERMSEHNARERERVSPYSFAYFVLNEDRKALYGRINARVDAMMEEGLLDEVKRLKGMGYDRRLVSMQGLGYKELLAYLDGEIDLEEAVSFIKRNTRRFAKRQLTWFRRERDVVWLNREEFQGEGEMLDKMLDVVKKDVLGSEQGKTGGGECQ